MIERQAAPAGWYLDGRNPRRRYWDGSQWTDHFEKTESPPSIADEMTPSIPRRIARAGRPKRRKLPKEQLNRIFEAEILRLTRKGWVLEGTGFGRSATFHRSKWRLFWRDLLLTVITVGLWLLYVIIRTLGGKSTSLILTVDRFGRVKTFRQKNYTGGDWSDGG